jgi:hypothetical protein
VSVTVKWDGLAEFKAALRNLPEELTHDAGAIVYAHAEEAGRLVGGAYPVRKTNLRPGPNRKTPFYPPGNLKRGVRTTTQTSRFGAAGVVRSSAPHSHLFERGTRTRQTNAGANRGSMPAAPESQQMIPIVIRVRRRMVMQLIALVQKAGFKVEAPS